MRSLRLDPELDEKLQRAAALTGETVSEFIRNAVEERADSTLSAHRADQFADVIGVVHGGGGRAARSGEAFKKVLARRKPA